MGNENKVSPEGYVDVRYNLTYSVFMLLAGIGFVIWPLLSDKEGFMKYYLLLLGLIFLIHGVYAISGRKYIRYDPQGKIISFFGLLELINRKVKYDNLFFRGKDLFRVIKGKTRFINVIRSQCNKEDLDFLFQEIKKDILFISKNIG
jgi:hypothetical protein